MQPARSTESHSKTGFKRDILVNLEEYEELICGGIVAAGGLGLMIVMFVFGHVGNAMAAVKAAPSAQPPKLQQHLQISQATHMAPSILNDHNSTSYMFSTAESVTSRFGRPRQF